MKKVIIFATILFISLIYNDKVFAVDYSKAENWSINSSEQVTGDYDVFYIYPTLLTSNQPSTFDWSIQTNQNKVKTFSTAQTSFFDKEKVRVFAPFVRQADFYTIVGEAISNIENNFNYNNGLAKYGIQDTADALNYYLKHYNNGRPYILLGHSQGSIDLLYAMKKTELGDNFLAAYLIGLPNAKRETLTFNNVKPAESADDLGVIAVWNSQDKAVNNNCFATPNGYVINPLNWRTDEKWASRFSNKISRIYDSNTNKFTTKHFLTGAKVDKKRGVLLVNLPKTSIYDDYSTINKGVYHSSDVWIFSNAIATNATHRFEVYKKLQRKYDRCELGDLVGDDVIRVRIAKFNIDYHSNKFKKEEVEDLVEECVEEGVSNQYQMDCCINQKMYPNTNK